ncbi:MAG: phosphate ABC transporter substrate-binding protein [bacterium]|nr:phosphate ABC transporter substrate-binding protein [bacterium]
MRISRIIVIMACALGVGSFVWAEELTIVGTGNGMEILKAIGEAFNQLNPETTIQVPPSIDSGGGIKAVGRDEYLLGRVAREIKDKEKPYGLTYVPFVKIPTVFVVNTTVNVRDLSPQQVLDIYSGKITNWKEVGGDDKKIKVITREEGSSALKVLRNTFPGFRDITVTSRSKTTVSQIETIEAVEKIADAIAYGSYDNTKKANVHILTIDSISASEADYPYVGMLAFVYKEAKYADTVKEFVEFALSEFALKAIKKAGGIPF